MPEAKIEVVIENRVSSSQQLNKWCELYDYLLKETSGTNKGVQIEKIQKNRFIYHKTHRKIKAKISQRFNLHRISFFQKPIVRESNNE